MEPILLACLGYVSLAFLLTLLMTTLRSWLTLSGKRAANSFGVDGSDVSPFAQRLSRAHANCYENAPYLCLIVLVATSTGRLELLNGLAYVFLAARVLQSTTHLIATTNGAVIIRALFFFTQVLIQVYWMLRLVLPA